MTWEGDKFVRIDYVRISATDYALLGDKATGELLWRQDIDYTPTGQKRTAVETSATATGFSTRRVYWQYDELDQLTLENVDSPGTTSDYQTRYILDIVGNRGSTTGMEIWVLWEKQRERAWCMLCVSRRVSSAPSG